MAQHLQGLIIMNKTHLQNLLALAIRLEDKTKEHVTPDEYKALVRLAQEVEAPSFVTEYFARKALTQPE
jgi:hypothetical protein